MLLHRCKIISLILFLSLTFFNCSNDEDCCLLSPQIADEEWLSVSIKRDRELYFAPDDIRLSFDTDSTFTLLLDVNRCNGSMQLDLETGVFNTVAASCTYMCCDSEYALALDRFIREADRFEFISKELILYRDLDEARFELK
ncbi:MAG: hypothetical protein AAF242_18735 [Bacteroidota bacterium]